MDRKEIEQGVIDIINKQVFIPKMVSGLEAFIADYIEELLDAQMESDYDRYYNINQEQS